MTPKLYTIIYIKSIKKLREKDENEKKGTARKRETDENEKRGTEENEKRGTEENEKKGRRKILTFEKKGRTLLVTLFMFG